MDYSNDTYAPSYYIKIKQDIHKNISNYSTKLQVQGTALVSI